MSTEAIVDFADLRLHAPNAMEARVLYHEIFETEAYCKHGITVRDGDCVFDVGANIGLFSVFLARRHAKLSLFAFEPLPPVFALLERNAALHLKRDAKLFAFGLGAKAERVTFRFDPKLTFASSAHPDDLVGSMQRDAGVFAWGAAVVADGMRTGDVGRKSGQFATRWIEHRVFRWLLAPLLSSLFALDALAKRLRTRDVSCELRRLSDVVREHEVARIDLLKIDVEGAEEAVLAGIDDADWPKVRQLVIEVHDTGGRVARMRELLVAKGYDVVVDREDWATHELLGIRTIYARRP
jgi:hypothetical protein